MMELVSQMVATRKMSTVCTFVYTIDQNSEDIGFNFTVGVLGFCIELEHLALRANRDSFMNVPSMQVVGGLFLDANYVT